MTSRSSGFTLVEMVIAITILSFAGVLLSLFAEVQSGIFSSISNRAVVANKLNGSLRTIELGLVSALPNSIRATSQSIEIIPVNGVARYRSVADSADDDFLDFTAPDISFEYVGRLSPTQGSRLVIYNGSHTTSGEATAGINAYSSLASDGSFSTIGSHVISGAYVLNDVDARTSVVFPVAHLFSFSSPVSRVYSVGPPVTYLCDSASGRLYLYDSYGFKSRGLTTRAAFLSADATESVIANEIEDCSFSYNPSSSNEPAMVAISISTSIDGERVSMLREMIIPNGM